MTYPQLVASWVGRPVVFRLVPGVALAAGKVESAVPTDPVGPRRVPNATLTVRGRSGRVAEVDVLTQVVRMCDSWEEAEKLLGENKRAQK